MIFNMVGGGGSSNVISDKFDPNRQYQAGDYCIDGNRLWKCLVDCINVKPTEGTYWTACTVASELQPLKASKVGARVPISTSVYICPADGYIWLYNASGQLGYVGIGNGPGHPVNFGGAVGRFSCFVKKGMPVQVVGTVTSAAFVPIA